ncbi:hypothetical protein ACQCVH_22120 [Bacillus infantis]|uniref:hypothetical protein n=1 Tax=Bacillus infantis TaxID=324767 RepID=UPI003CE6756A
MMHHLFFSKKVKGHIKNIKKWEEQTEKLLAGLNKKEKYYQILVNNRKTEQAAWVKTEITLLERKLALLYRTMNKAHEDIRSYIRKLDERLLKKFT